jgi:transposase
LKKEKKETPSLLVGDSQAVKNTDSASSDTKGFCFYKNVNGIKRHLYVDTLGNILFVHCTPANVSDDQGLLEMITKNLEFFKQKRVSTKKITILLDNGYHKEKLETELRKIYPQILTKIRIKVTPKPTKDPNNPGFKPVHKRWVVERTNAWLEKCRVLWKNCERQISTSIAKVQLALIRLQIKRLAKG